MPDALGHKQAPCKTPSQNIHRSALITALLDRGRILSHLNMGREALEEVLALPGGIGLVWW